MVRGLIIQSGWVVFFMITSRWLMHARLPPLQRLRRLEDTLPIPNLIPKSRMSQHPSYLGVFVTFARNSLIRDMTFRANFIIEAISSMSWMIMNLGFYLLVYSHTKNIADWASYEFFVFISTTMLVNSFVQAFFMPNCPGTERAGADRWARFCTA